MNINMSTLQSQTSKKIVYMKLAAKKTLRLSKMILFQN